MFAGSRWVYASGVGKGRLVQGRRHPHHWWGGNSGERLEVGTQLGLDELMDTAERTPCVLVRGP